MKQDFNKICVVGLGYIGLPTAATFAARGLDVIGLEVSQSVVDTINQGHAHIVEPELDMLVKGAVSKDNADAHLLKYAREVEQAEIITPWADTLMARIVAEALLDGCQALIDGDTTPKKIMSNIRTRQATFKSELEAADGSIVATEE